MKLTFGDLNPDSYFPHPTNTYTYKMTIVSTASTVVPMGQWSRLTFILNIFF